jgi:hypothetical protein
MAGILNLTGGGTATLRGVGDHWTDLAAYTTSVRNILARPGMFDTIFPETTDDGLVGLLQDALAECHMEATLLGYEADSNAQVRPAMMSGEIALVVLYAGIRMIRAELLNRISSSKYVAGPVSAETTYATNVLRDIMKALEVQKDAVTTKLTTLGAGMAFFMEDQYTANAFRFPPNGVPLAYWLPMQPAWLPMY